MPSLSRWMLLKKRLDEFFEEIDMALHLRYKGQDHELSNMSEYGTYNISEKDHYILVAAISGAFFRSPLTRYFDPDSTEPFKEGFDKIVLAYKYTKQELSIIKKIIMDLYYV